MITATEESQYDSKAATSILDQYNDELLQETLEKLHSLRLISKTASGSTKRKPRDLQRTSGRSYILSDLYVIKVIRTS